VPEIPVLHLASAAVRAGRRRQRLSQRAFAAAAGLSAATVARIETASPQLRFAHVRAALAMVGLRLVVVHDHDGTPWSLDDEGLQVDSLDLRNQAGRRFPAHLEEEYRPWLRSWTLSRHMRRGWNTKQLWTYQHRPRNQF
jgi:transcriptional regulator with XRE-family HTH domain